ncbi:MAG TPA: response regulator transcription factor [Anaerolineae bacterium]|nr:response regulator transcription factor [Anaerolineae bacterium]
MYALLICQNPDERAFLSLVLQRAGLAVTTAGTLERALDTWQERPADIILITSAGDPLDEARRIRAETSVPLIQLVEGSSEATCAQALELGADLVVARPFGVRLLVAQVKALMRRARNVPLVELPTLSVSGLTLDPSTRSVAVEGLAPRRLTHLEFRLLYDLMIHRAQILSPEVIVERVWGYSGQGDRDLVRGLVSRLRAKVEPEPRNPRYIRTEPGVGYSFDPEETPVP